jgi:hypothetical protein
LVQATLLPLPHCIAIPIRTTHIPIPVPINTIRTNNPHPQPNPNPTTAVARPNEADCICCGDPGLFLSFTGVRGVAMSQKEPLPPSVDDLLADRDTVHLSLPNNVPLQVAYLLPSAFLLRTFYWISMARHPIRLFLPPLRIFRHQLERTIPQ